MQESRPETKSERRKSVTERVMLTSTFKPRELLCIDRETGETRFVEPRVPDGISLRNFGIQVVSSSADESREVRTYTHHVYYSRSLLPCPTSSFTRPVETPKQR
jgi:hypothetical protein